MKINWESKSTYVHRMQEWHRFFAWYPVKGEEKLMWLEYVERSASSWPEIWILFGWDWQYRPYPKKKELEEPQQEAGFGDGKYK